MAKDLLKVIALLLIILVSACKHNGELAETMLWMDNTYNPHDSDSGSSGHGRTGWYEFSSGEQPEQLVDGSIETFTHNGCQMTLRIEDNQSATAHHDVYGTFTSTFNLSDINPQSITTSTYSHSGGLRCESYKPEERQIYNMNCDHAEITFVMHSEAPLINEESHTTFALLKGSDHESHGQRRDARASFEVDNVEYAGRFAKAFRHAVELCGGKPEVF